MSTELLANLTPVLLIASLTLALWAALAFRRACPVHALGAPRAHVLHARALSRRAALPHSTRPVPGPCSTAEPRTSSPTLHATALTPHSAAGRAFGGTPASAASLYHGRRRPNHTSAPAAPMNSSSLSRSSSARARRRHVALQLQHGCRRRSYPQPPRSSLERLFKGSPNSFKTSGDLRLSS